MPATQTVADFGRIAVLGTVAVVKVTVNATSVPYVSANGGLPIDLTAVLQAASPFSAPIHPNDVVDIYPVGLSANGYLPVGLTLGTPTYTTLPGSSVRPVQVLATFPANIRLVGSGASSGAAFAEIANGNVTDTITFHLALARGGTNTN